MNSTGFLAAKFISWLVFLVLLKVVFVIDKIIDVKDDGNCEYWSVSDLLGMGQDSWSVVRNHLLKELSKFSVDYIKLFGGTERFEELRMSLLVEGLTKVCNLCM